MFLVNYDFCFFQLEVKLSKKYYFLKLKLICVDATYLERNGFLTPPGGSICFKIAAERLAMKCDFKQLWDRQRHLVAP